MRFKRDLLKRFECFIDVYFFSSLNFNKNPLYLGGIFSADPVLERPAQLHSDDFVGCIHSVSINGRALNLSNPLSSRGITPTCNRKTGGACSAGLSNDPAQIVCGTYDCSDRWYYAMCKCGGNSLSPNCYDSLDPISLTDGGFLEFKISEKFRRMKLLESFYVDELLWQDEHLSTNQTTSRKEKSPHKMMSIMFRTLQPNGIIIYASTNKHYSTVELRNGKIFYQSQYSHLINVTMENASILNDGKWHNVALHSINQIVAISIDGRQVGDDFDASGVHDFADPYLNVISIGGIRRDLPYQENVAPVGFNGCFANFSIGNEVQPFNGSGSIFRDIVSHGKVYQGCHNVAGIGAAQVTDPLSIGITLVIIFFVMLLVAIFGSFVVFRLRKQYKEKSGVSGVLQSKHNVGSNLLGNCGLPTGSNDGIIGRGLHGNDTSVGYLNADNADMIRPHHMANELLTKKFKERELGTEPQRPQRPDIIEREVVTKSPLPREEHHPTIQMLSQHHALEHPGGVDLSEFPEHYDLENASSIAPSDIDIVYHYKGYRETGNIRKYKATPAPLTPYHKQVPSQQQQRHSPHNPSPYGPRVPPPTQATKSMPTSSAARQHQSTPLARLSPSSELSSQHPRILTLHDISGKPLQSALLATTSSSGGVGKDALHSNSERSMNSPVMSQLSGQSSGASRSKQGIPTQPTMKAVNTGSQTPIGLTAEEIQRLNVRPRTSSLVSTLDAVSSSSEVPHVPNVSHHLSHLHHSAAADANSSTSSDESGNDSFTCSEIDYDNASLNGENFSKNTNPDCSRTNDVTNTSKKNTLSLAPPSYDGFDSSFRGSLSTLIASDEEISNQINGIYRSQNSTSPSTLGWDYLLNWGLNIEKLMGVFNDIAELPDTVNGDVSSIRRMPTNILNSSEEYV